MPEAVGDAPSETFVSEALRPTGTGSVLPPRVGEPALPLQFVWRRQVRTVQSVRRAWKALDPDRTHGGCELYLRRHWFELQMDDGAVWTVYFQRQPASRRRAKARWWLYCLSSRAD